MHLKSMGLTAAAILCAAAFTATAAAAFEGPAWSVGETEVSESVAVKSKDVGGITFEDTSTIVGSVSVQCSITDEGSVRAQGKGEVTTISATACKNVKQCSGTITAKAVHLPWASQLEEVEGKPRLKISNSGAGAPGWSVECTILGVKVKDECTGETTTGVEDVTGGVDLAFDSSSAHGNCSLGGTGTGRVTGVDLEENPAGKLLRADNNVTGGATKPPKPVGPGKPFVFQAGEKTQNLILRNPGALRRQYLNGVMDIPGVVSVNNANFTLAAVGAKPCGEALAGGAECEIAITSNKAGEKGEYQLLYGNAANEIELKFELKS
ncbi:MAG TPA: hypothetical protein VK781_05580 [Solirubrobacteraceae bacterium]|jgi:hypothetical protein|nr:hypothetical protein [Solirubrobacteraceae bacterium]